MKKILWILILGLFPFIQSNAEGIDTAVIAKGVQVAIQPLVKSIDSLKDKIGATNNNEVQKPSKSLTALITLSPIALFLSVCFIVMIKLRNDNVKLSDILIDKEALINITSANAAANTAYANAIASIQQAFSANPIAFANNPPQPPNPPTQIGNAGQSASRLVLFISGIVAIGLACCIASFYFYRSFTSNVPVSIDNLANILYGLGIGVIPYGVSKVAEAFRQPANR